MSKHPISFIILAAGQSSRMRSDTSKIIHKLAGWPVLGHVLELTNSVQAERVCLVTSPGGQAIRDLADGWDANVQHVVQETALGTGHAVRTALEQMGSVEGTIVVMFGDSPLMQPETLSQIIEAADHAPLVVSAFEPEDVAQYGRVVRDAKGHVSAIVEYKDASQQQRAITLCNAGVMAFDAEQGAPLMQQIDNDNAKGEYYLPDLVALSYDQGMEVALITMPEEQTLGINNRAELAQAEAIMQRRLRDKALGAGVGMVAPETVFLSMDTQCGYDVLLHPYITFGTGVVLGDYTEVRSFCHLEGVTTEAHVVLGPYARIRPGSHLAAHCHIGNFVEIKNTHMAEGAKAGHLSYLGDSAIGVRTNIGAGTITCNYDGKAKHHTQIGADAFIGSNSALVAPVAIGDEVTVAAGSVITESVEKQQLVIARSRQVSKTKK